MPAIITSAFPEFMYSPNDDIPSSLSAIFKMATATAAPSNSNTIETVVEVGSPKVLKVSNKIISVSITAKKIIMMFVKLNISG